MPRPRLLASLPALPAALALAACGSGSSPDAGALVRQTFGNGAKVRSGQLSVAITVATHGLPSLSRPIEIRFAGPFDTPAGTNQVPQFSFTLSGSIAGQNFSAGATSTGARGYLSLGKESYPLPPAQFATFRKSFASIQGIAQPKPNAAGTVPWLTDPKVEGGADVSGQSTTHVSAGVDVGLLIDQLEGKRPAAQRLSASQRQGVVAAVRKPRFDFYTGKDDKILRRVRIVFGVAVPSASRSSVGGLTGADVTIDYAIADLNRPQTIGVPSNLRPESELSPRLKGLAQKLRAIGSLIQGAGGSGSSGQGQSLGSTQIQRYQACLTQAAGDDAAVKKCLQILQKSP